MRLWIKRGGGGRGRPRPLPARATRAARRGAAAVRPRVPSSGASNRRGTPSPGGSGEPSGPAWRLGASVPGAVGRGRPGPTVVVVVVEEEEVEVEAGVRRPGA